MSDALDPTTTDPAPDDGSASASTTVPAPDDGSGGAAPADVQALMQELHALKSRIGQYESRDTGGGGTVAPPTYDPSRVDPIFDPDTMRRDEMAIETYAGQANDPMARELVRVRRMLSGLHAQVGVLAAPEPLREETDKILRAGLVANAEIARELAEARMAKRTPAPPSPPTVQPRPAVRAMTHTAPIPAAVGGEIPKMSRSDYQAKVSDPDLPMNERVALRKAAAANKVRLTD